MEQSKIQNFKKPSQSGFSAKTLSAREEAEAKMTATLRSYGLLSGLAPKREVIVETYIYNPELEISERVEVNMVETVMESSTFQKLHLGGTLFSESVNYTSPSPMFSGQLEARMLDAKGELLGFPTRSMREVSENDVTNEINLHNRHLSRKFECESLILSPSPWREVRKTLVYADRGLRLLLNGIETYKSNNMIGALMGIARRSYFRVEDFVAVKPVLFYQKIDENIYMPTRSLLRWFSQVSRAMTWEEVIRWHPRFAESLAYLNSFDVLIYANFLITSVNEDWAWALNGMGSILVSFRQVMMLYEGVDEMSEDNYSFLPMLFSLPRPVSILTQVSPPVFEEEKYSLTTVSEFLSMVVNSSTSVVPFINLMGVSVQLVLSFLCVGLVQNMVLMVPPGTINPCFKPKWVDYLNFEAYQLVYLSYGNGFGLCHILNRIEPIRHSKLQMTSYEASYMVSRSSRNVVSNVSSLIEATSFPQSLDGVSFTLPPELVLKLFQTKSHYSLGVLALVNTYYAAVVSRYAEAASVVAGKNVTNSTFFLEQLKYYRGLKPVMFDYGDDWMVG